MRSKVSKSRFPAVRLSNPVGLALMNKSKHRNIRHHRPNPNLPLMDAVKAVLGVMAVNGVVNLGSSVLPIASITTNATAQKAIKGGLKVGVAYFGSKYTSKILGNKVADDLTLIVAVFVILDLVVTFLSSNASTSSWAQYLGLPYPAGTSLNPGSVAGNRNNTGLPFPSNAAIPSNAVAAFAQGGN